MRDDTRRTSAGRGSFNFYFTFRASQVGNAFTCRGPGGTDVLLVLALQKFPRILSIGPRKPEFVAATADVSNRGVFRGNRRRVTPRPQFMRRTPEHRHLPDHIAFGARVF